MLVQVAVLRQEVGLDGAEGLEEDVVVAGVKAVDHLGQRCKVDFGLGFVLCRGSGAECGQVDCRRLGCCARVDFHVRLVPGRDGARESGQAVVRVIGANNGADLGRIDDARFKVAAREGDRAHEDGIYDERRVGAEFVASKGA